MEFEIRAGLLQKLLEAAAVVIEEPTLLFSEKGMVIVSFDEAHVFLLQMGVRKSEFEVYDVEGKQRICFDAGILSSYLRGAEGTAMLTVDKAKIDLMLPSKYGFKTFEVPLFAETGVTRVPKIELDSRCKVDLGALRSVVRDAERVKAEYCRFLARDEGIEVVIKGEKGNAKNMLELGKGIIDSELTTKSKFIITLLSLKDILKVGSLFTNVVLFEFSEKLYPCRLTFQVPYDGNLIMYIAPIDDKEVYGK